MDWEAAHKFECKCLKRFTRITRIEYFEDNVERFPAEDVRLWIRTYSRLKTLKQLDGWQTSWDADEMEDSAKRCFWDLKPHTDDFKTTDRFVKEYETMLNHLQLMLDEKTFASVKDGVFESIQNRLKINSMDVFDRVYTTCGRAIDFQLASYNHECFSPFNLRLGDKTRGQIPKIEVSVLCRFSEAFIPKISYINCFKPSAVRKKELKANYFFDCKCQWCEGFAANQIDAALISLKCQGCAQGPVPIDPGSFEPSAICKICDSGKAKITEHQLKFAKSHMIDEKTGEFIDPSEKTFALRFDKAGQEFTIPVEFAYVEKYFSDMNCYKASAMATLVQLLEEFTPDVINYVNEELQGWDTYFPYSLNLAEKFNLLHEMQYEQGLYGDAMESLSKALHICKQFRGQSEAVEYLGSQFKMCEEAWEWRKKNALESGALQAFGDNPEEVMSVDDGSGDA